MATVLTTIFTYVDDFCQAQPIKRRSGPEPEVSDSEVITAALWCELVGIASEHEQVRFVETYLRPFFPRFLDRSRYHRRRSVMAGTFERMRRMVLAELPLALQDLHILDSTPVPVMCFRRSGLTPLFPEAAYGYCAAKREHYFGFKLHLVVDRTGIPLHFELTPANVADGSMSEELLTVSSAGHVVLGDKGYLSQKTQTQLFSRQGTLLLTPTRRNQKRRESKAERDLLNAWRQRIEVVNAMLKDRFEIGATLAKTLKGLVVRLVAKLTAFVFGIFINRLHGRPPLALADWAV